MQAKLKLSELEICDLMAKALSEHVFCFDVKVDSFAKDGYEFIIAYEQVDSENPKIRRIGEYDAMDASAKKVVK